MKSFLYLSTAIGLTALSASAATAATLDLKLVSPTAGTSFVSNATVTHLPAGTGATPGREVAMGQIVIDTLVSKAKPFVVWCVDLAHSTSMGKTYTYTSTNTPFSNSYGLDAQQMSRVQKMFNANYGTLDIADTTEAAGFQLALWETLYDTDYSLSTGLFQANADSQAVASAAATYLSAAQSYTGKQRWNLGYLESQDNSQNYVAPSPVPVPAAGLLMLASLAGLGVARRRRDI